ncbi:MAG: pectinesterase family protein [Acidobacteriota bacterium]
MLKRAALLIACVALSSGASLAQVAPHPTRIVLVGDSTVTDDSGWGLGFKQMVRAGVIVLNTAANGRSSKSYIDEGRWQAALAMRGDYYLIQFGHNDEPGKGPERETDPSTTYAANLQRYVDEVRAQGATPIVVTSLVRRLFEPGSSRVRSTQTAYVQAARRVAAENHVPLIDLFARSSVIAERLGQRRLESFSARQADGTVDTTHLNGAGSLLFGRLVAEDLAGIVPQLAGVILKDPRPASAVAIEHPPDAIVSPSGPATYKTVQEAIDALPQTTTADRRWVILVLPGTYRERIYAQREKRFVSLVGADPLQTTITFNAKASDIGPDNRPIGTYRTPTVTIDADDFAIENLTIENGSGPGSQALALRVDGDRLVVRNSRLLGWQDTLFVDRGRQYFEDTLIAGHVDFIFGGATSFFERCRLHAWRDGYITAASTPPESPFGFVFDNSRITGASPDVRTYLGRPWRGFARVTWLHTRMSGVVRPEGWHNWDSPERERTTRYEEFASEGDGASPAGRAVWAHPLTTSAAAAYSVTRVLGGPDRWDPRGVRAYSSATRALDDETPAAPGPAGR